MGAERGAASSGRVTGNSVSSKARAPKQVEQTEQVEETPDQEEEERPEHRVDSEAKAGMRKTTPAIDPKQCVCVSSKGVAAESLEI